MSLSLSDISYKEIVLNYIKTHDVPYHLKEYIEDELQKCISDSEVYELIIRINHRLNIVNCFEMGFRVHVPIRFEDEIASYDSLTVLNKKTPHPVITTEWGLFQKLKNIITKTHKTITYSLTYLINIRPVLSGTTLFR